MLIKKVACIWYVLSLICVKSLSQKTTDTPIISLKESIEIAIKNNLQVKQSDLQMQTANVNLKQARANLLPGVGANISHGINQGRSIDPFTNSYINQQVNYANYSIGTSLVLFNGGLLRNSVKENSFAYEASKYEYQEEKDLLTLDVILAYLQILNNEDQFIQSSQQAGVTRTQVERLDILNKEGAIASSLLSDLKGELAIDELALIDNRNTLETARLTLAQLMNVPYVKNLRVERLNADQFSIQYESDPEKIYQLALENLATVKAAELRKQSAERAVSVAKGDLYPTLTLNGNLFSNYSNAATRDILLNTIEVPSGDYVVVNGNQEPVITRESNFASEKIRYNEQLNNNYSTSVSLGLRIPIFNSFQARNRVKLAKINLINTEYIEETTKIQLKQSIEGAYFNLTAAQDRYKWLSEQVNAFTESFRAAEVRFNAGVGTSVDYVVAKNNLDRANINLISARYDYVLRAKILDYYQGKPLW